MKYMTDFDVQLDKKAALTIGKFDGFHLGHQELIQHVKDYATKNNLVSIVLSFYPHPIEVLFGVKNFKTIFTRQEKIEILEKMGIDIYIEYPFTEAFSKIDPVIFVEKILFNKLKSKYVAIGEDYKFGKNQQGTGELLRNLATQNNVNLEIIKDIELNGEKISSTLVKKYISQNDFDTTRKLMSRPYCVAGKVVDGKKLGRTIGFPTVNLLPSPTKFLPDDGVYFTKTYYQNRAYNSITNIGTNPTVTDANQEKKRSVETYIFDFAETIYGEEIEVEFVKWLRNEVKFNNLQELQNQIHRDIIKAQTFII